MTTYQLASQIMWCLSLLQCESNLLVTDFPIRFWTERHQHSPANLNDVCINSCAALLYSKLKVLNISCMILSTHDLPHIWYNAPDEFIWCQCSWMHYWEKDIWVRPIHWPSHVGYWVFCAIYLPSKELHLFNSLGDEKPWKHDIKVCSYD